MALKDIETIIVVILENRSFDHAVGYLSTASANPPMKVDGIRDDPKWRETHVNSYKGMPFEIHPLAPDAQSFEDPPHEQKTIATQINTPSSSGSPNRMGGFVESYMTRTPPPADPTVVMGYYTKEAVPVFDFFARNFAICDRWFSALPTGTQPNRLMAMSGESSIVDNATVFLQEQDLVYDWLKEQRVSWCAYQSGDFFPFFSLMPRWLPEIMASLALSELGGRGNFRRYSKFKEHWNSTNPMPSVIFIEPEYTDGPHLDPNDDHPPTGIAKGQAFLADIYSTLISNPTRWQNTMMIVTYDEHGGFFDHVPPLPISTNVSGQVLPTTGVRVPAFIISPHVDAGTVISKPFDHTSILQLLADRFHANQEYSSAVGVRQPFLSPLATVLNVQPPQTARRPAIPDLAAIQAAAASVASPVVTTEAPGAASTAQAFHNAAIKAAQDHSDLVASSGWQSLASYVDRCSVAHGFAVRAL